MRRPNMNDRDRPKAVLGINLCQDQIEEIDKIVERRPGNFHNRSDFIRWALDHVLRNILEPPIQEDES